MQVILLERMEKLGHIGDVVNVKMGFARNFLLPQSKALRATKANLEVFEEQRAVLEEKNKDKQKAAEDFAKTIEGKTFSLVRQASANDQLYGSVTVRDISNLLSDSDIEFSRQQIKLDKPIKTIGMHGIKLKPHPEVNVQIYVNIAKSSEEADAQMQLLLSGKNKSNQNADSDIAVAQNDEDANKDVSESDAVEA